MPLTTNDIASVADERVDPEPGDDDAVRDARPRGRRRGRRATPAGVETDAGDVSGRRAGQPVDRADGQVDPARDEDERAGAGDDDDPGLLVEDVGEVLEPQERRADDAQHDERDQERDEDAGPPDGTDRPSRRCGRRVLRRCARPCSRSCGGRASRAERRGQDALPRSSPSPASSATTRPARMTSDAMGEAEDLLDLVRDEQDRRRPSAARSTSSS